MAVIKDLAHPVWEQVVEDWLGNIPASLDPPTVTVEQLLRVASASLSDKADIDVVEGLREATFGDALFLRLKALNFLEASRSLTYGGYNTLTALTVYDACFLAAKSLVYLLGVRDVGGGQKWYIELFRSFKRSKSVVSRHVGLQLGTRLEHEILWQLLTRLINTCKGDSTGSHLLNSMRKNDYASFSKERNALIYGASSWSRYPALDKSDLAFPLVYVDNHLFLKDSGYSTAEYVDKYLRTAYTLLNVIEWLLADIGAVASAVRDHLAAYSGPPTVNRVLF